MARKKQAKRSPSRIKYEQEHKVISFRETKEIHDRAEVVKKVEGKSNADIFKNGLGLNEVKIRAEKEISEEAYAEGWDDGYEAAQDEYMVTFPCSVCKKPLELTSPKAKEAVRKYMIEHRWGHIDCLKEKRQQAGF